MLEMSQINYIKRLREKEGCSISEIARRLKINWRTAKKYADGEVKIQKSVKQQRQKPVMGPYLSLIEAWLRENLRMPKKQRRTAKKIYNQLKECTDFDGSARSVRHYVKEIKENLIKAQKEQYVKLTHKPAEAQVDFEEFKAINPNDEKIVTYPFLVMSFPYSNAQVCRAVPAENIECFLEALKSMFEEIGGVPRTIWFDNLSAAVTKVLKEGERKLTKAFKEFEWHYRFEAKFCNVGRGNEKGHVENKVGYIRRNWMSPMPIIKDLNEFNEYLSKGMSKDRSREHSSKEKSIAELWKEDLNNLLVLPTNSKEIIRTEIATANKYGEIKIDKNYYHVASAHPGQNLLLKIYWDKIIVYDQYGEEKITQTPRKYIYKVDEIDWQGELEIFKNKPRAIEHATYLKALPDPIKEYLLAPKLSERRKRVKFLLKLLDDYTITEIETSISFGVANEKTSFADIRAILHYQDTQKKKQEPVGDFWTPESVSEWKPTLKNYNELCQEVFS